MIRAVLFDLDDTLYCESDYVRSGFTAVATELATRGIGQVAEICRLLESVHFTEGRERVFNKLACRLGFPDDWVPPLVEQYRAHIPNLSLAPDAAAVLAALRGRCKLGCVTDGWAATQRRKLEALRLSTLLDALVITDDLGRAHWKPSPLPFLTCCDLLGVGPAESLYVGDDPERDMRGARNAGMLSVRIRREQGYFRNCATSQDRPDFEIVSLLELEGILDSFTSPPAC